jgi:hypothetical protein
MGLLNFRKFLKIHNTKQKASKIIKKMGTSIMVITINPTFLVVLSALWTEYPLGAMLQVQAAA